VEWLLTMYSSSHNEVLRLEQAVDDLYTLHGEGMV
jgi:hypothetical protein